MELDLRDDVYDWIVSQVAFPQVANKKLKRRQTIADGFPDCISVDARGGMQILHSYADTCLCRLT